MARVIKILLNFIFSISIGLYFGLYFTLLSELSDSKEIFLSAAVFTVCIWTTVSIYKERNKKLQLIQLIILISAMVIGLYKASKDSESLSLKNSSRQFKIESLNI